MVKTEKVKIVCADGYELSATVYTPEQAKGAVMIAPATGIRKTFYHSFATFLAENGYGAICYDNRGIGESAKGSLRNSEISLIDWGQLDMPAVLKSLQQRFPNVSCHLIGHSAGGQLLGLMENAKDIQSMFNFACSSGSIRNMPYPFKIKAVFFLKVFIPVNNFLFGYTNSQWVGMGEPLPKKVGIQWQKWCSGKGYIEMEFGKTVHAHFYHELAIPTRWLHASDDGIANYENVKDMIRVYSAIQAAILTLEPKTLGYREIGHMRFFSSRYKSLWNYALDWLDGQ